MVLVCLIRLNFIGRRDVNIRYVNWRAKFGSLQGKCLKGMNSAWTTKSWRGSWFFDLYSPGNIYIHQVGRRTARAMAKLAITTTTFLSTLCMIFVLPSVLIAKRCDRQVDRYVWSNCMECSVNAFLLSPCPSGYSQVTSGEGEQRCFFPVNFGFNVGVISIPGCQHNCTRKITVKQCCDGFWGTDCQGIYYSSCEKYPILF